jgi:hypothetical protein
MHWLACAARMRVCGLSDHEGERYRQPVNGKAHTAGAGQEKTGRYYAMDSNAIIR